MTKQIGRENPCWKSLADWFWSISLSIYYPASWPWFCQSKFKIKMYQNLFKCLSKWPSKILLDSLLYFISSEGKSDTTKCRMIKWAYKIRFENYYRIDFDHYHCQYIILLPDNNFVKANLKLIKTYQILFKMFV